MYFIGVSTGGSSIMRLFPEWARMLGLTDAQLLGLDLPLHADAVRYRDAVVRIKDDPLSLGALVTTHKLNLLEAAGDLFDELDRYARLCREVSNIAKRDGRLLGFAKDPITAGRALGEMLEPDYWSRTDGQVLCLGAGGTTAALAAHLLSATDRPPRRGGGRPTPPPPPTPPAAGGAPPRPPGGSSGRAGAQPHTDSSSSSMSSKQSKLTVISSPSSWAVLPLA
jgi:hypothetical protein